MPALSPTMETGTLRSWRVKEGGSYAAGDTIAEIETDKATIDFEAQDDAFVAKILVPEGATDVKVGTPIMVTVEEEEYIQAFRHFLPTQESQPKLPEVNQPHAKQPEPAKVATEPPVTPADVAAAAMTLSPVWGEHVKVSSPILKTLSKSQKRYLEFYGSTGQLPV